MTELFAAVALAPFLLLQLPLLIFFLVFRHFALKNGSYLW